MVWSTKYKKSIDCSNPKGFSQKAFCAGRKKKQKENTIRKRVKKRHMKITEEDRKLFKKIKQKHNLKKEGILTKLFTKGLETALKNDKTLQKTLKDADKNLDKLSDRLHRLEDRGYDIPKGLQKYMK